MSDDDENVTKLPVRFKGPGPEGRTLVYPQEVGKRACYHQIETGAKFIIDQSLAEVECSVCGEKLNPMWVLTRLAAQDNRFQENHTRYQEEMKRLKERSRTKCQHCGEMTRISRR